MDEHVSKYTDAFLAQADIGHLALAGCLLLTIICAGLIIRALIQFIYAERQEKHSMALQITEVLSANNTILKSLDEYVRGRRP